MQTIHELGSYTFPALLQNSVKRFGERNALSLVNGTPITYSELAERSLHVSRILFSLGIKPGDKVAIYSTSHPNWGATAFGIFNYGAIAVPLLPDFNINEVETILKHAEVSCLFVAEKMFSRIEKLDSSIIPSVVRVEDFEVLRGELSCDPENIELPPAVIKEEDVASIIYTSGTTGRSKGVVLTQKNLVWTAIQCQTMHRVHKRDKCLSFLPLSHVYEFTIGFVMQMLNGSCVYYLGRPPTVSSLLPAFKKIRPTIVLSVPMIVEKIYKNKVLPTLTSKEFTKKLYNIRFFQKILHRIAGRSLKKTFGGRIVFFGIGGAKVDTQVERFMKDGKFPYAIGYGLTETSPLLAGSGPKITVPGTVGPVMQGVEMQILNPDPVTGIGEVIARGPNVMKGYYKEPKMTEEVFTTEADSCGPGWFKTGDLGELRNGIWLSLKGRLKNMILGASGENIYPEDIEFILNQHPLVTESLVVDNDGSLVALVQLDDDKIRAEAEKRAAGLGSAIDKKVSDTETTVDVENPVTEDSDSKSEIKKGILESVGDAVKDFGEDVLYYQESVLNEIQFFINQKVNRISRISEVKKVNEFEKTASQKIKRYLYNMKKGKKEAEEDLKKEEKNEKK